MDDKRYDMLKWRWEFMRRNRELKEDHRQILKLREKAKYEPENPKSYFLTHEYKKEIEFCVKWDLRMWLMPDPNISFEECIKNADHIERLKFLIGLGSGAVEMINKARIPDDEFRRMLVNYAETAPNQMLINIDFDKVNSIGDLQTVVRDLLSAHYEASRLKMDKKKLGNSRTKTKRKQTYDVDFETILTVGVKKEKENLKNQYIAKKLFPRDYRRNPESTTRNISHIYNRYKDLVNGGYRNITYP